MKRLAKRIIDYTPYTRKKSSNAIDIKKLGKFTDEIVDNYMNLVLSDWSSFVKLIRYSNSIGNKTFLSQEYYKEEIKTLITDAVSTWIKTKSDGLFSGEYFSIFIHKLKSGKTVITLYNNIEI